jgi:2-amino-4-hydroxy-6-hydroxymethyldihydropteridine diphosphokinase
MALPWARPGWMSAAGETSVFGHLASGGETARSTDPASAAEAPGSTALSASGETSVFGDMPRFGETSGRSDGSRFGETSYGEPPSFGEISRSGMHDAGTHVPTPPPRSHAVFERPVLGLPPAGRGREWRELKPPSGLLDQIAEIGPAPENLPQVPAVQPKGPIAIVSSMDERPHRPVDAILSLGANLGDALWSLRSAIEDLRRTDGIVVDAVSPLARSAPMGPVEQGDYFNAVVQIRTNLSARELLHVVQQIEDRHGRSREQRWGPRTLDIDVVTYDTLLDVDDELELPHPGAHRRAFVLVPWAAFSPDAFLPGLGGGNVSILAERAPDRDGIRWLALGWETGTIATSGAVPKAAASAF